MYCSTTRLSSSSWVSTLTTTDVPFGFTCTPMGAAFERSVEPGDDRLVETHVLLAVHDEHQDLGRNDPGHGAGHRVPDRHDGEHGRCDLTGDVGRVRVVRGRGVRLRAVGFDLELGSLRPVTQLVDSKAHGMLLVWWRAGL